MLFFDFLYYHLYKFYSGYKEKGAASTSAGIIGGFQTLNALTAMIVFSLMHTPKLEINKLEVIVLFLISQIYTYIRYIYIDKNSIDVIEHKWLEKTDGYRKRIITLLFIYGIISIIGCFGAAIYLGSSS